MKVTSVHTRINLIINYHIIHYVSISCVYGCVM